jgi:hypothetical protein
LSAQTKRERLTANEQHELDHLLTLNDRAMLLLSEALRLLKNRGHDIAAYVEYGT